MRKLTGIFILSTVLITSGLISCKSDEEKIAECSIAWGSELQDELSAISTAATAYSNNPSTATCSAYKIAYQEYIDALEPYGDCAALTGQFRSAWEQAVQDARDNLNTLCEE